MKNSIKKAQSQACLGFAEQKNFRPLAKLKKLSLTLALLITAVGGAWAQETPLLTIESKNYTSFKSGSMTFDDMVTVTFSNEVENAGDEYGWNIYNDEATPVTMTVTAVKGYTINSVKLYTYDGTLTDTEAPFVATLYGSSYYPKTTISDQANGIWGGVAKIEVYGTAPDPNAVEVTTNDGNTEASFQMPAFDATAEYELVRDMSVQMTATMGDGSDGVRYRVKKAQQGEGYEPADMNMTQVLALVAVNDGIEHKDLTLDQDYFCRIYKLDEQTLQPTDDGVALADFDFAPGLYALKAVAKDDTDYDGETALSNTFQLVEKVDLTLDPAPVVNMTVTTTEGEADPVEATAEQLEAGKIEQLEPGTKVELKAKKGYKFIKVVAKEEQ